MSFVLLVFCGDGEDSGCLEAVLGLIYPMHEWSQEMVPS